MAINTRRVTKGPYQGYVHSLSGPHDLIAVGHKGRGSRADSWYGGNDAPETYRKSIEGDETYKAHVESLLEKVNATVNVETNAYVIENAIVGFTPDVPSAIMGIPGCMITMEATQADFAPITVWCNVTTSAGVSAEDAARKGAAVAALVLKIQAIRPVNLNVMIGLDAKRRSESQFVVVPINARPFSLAQLSYILCNPGWARHTYFTVCEDFGYDGGWDEIFLAHRRTPWSKEMANETLTFLGGDLEHDIYIPPLHLSDPFLKDPIGWVEGTLEKYRRQG